MEDVKATFRERIKQEHSNPTTITYFPSRKNIIKKVKLAKKKALESTR